MYNFYPRSPCGERPGKRAQRPKQPNFYPRSPCGERQLSLNTQQRHLTFLSTLSLRRATSADYNCRSARLISIHALLAESDRAKKKSTRQVKHFYPRSPCGERRWRATTDILRRHFYPRSPCGERLKLFAKRFSNSLFLSTLSLRRATSLIIFRRAPAFYFYPRSPCGERPRYLINARYTSNFYPRSPCGERPLAPKQNPTEQNFYPRSPCGERHAADISARREARISIHALLAESDRSWRL